MAEEIKRVLTIDTGQSTQTVKGLKQEISGLKDSLLNVSKGGDDWQKIVEQIIAKQEQLNDVTKISKTNNDAAKDSIVGMEQEYRNLYNTYKLLSEEQRSSDFGKNMAESLATLHEKLNETKINVGNFKDNIGNYTQSAMQAFQQMGISVGALAGPMKIATAASNGLGASLKALIANPVGAIIMAIVIAFKALKGIVDKVKEAINNNEESQMRLKEAMSAFQPIIDGVKNAFDWLGKKVVSVVEFIGQAVSKIREFAGAVTDFLGITDGAQDRIAQENSNYREIAALQNSLIRHKRELQKLNSKDTAEVERLREEAQETENLVQKKEMLTKAKALQETIDMRNLELAQKNLEVLQREAQLTANNTEMNDKLADAEAAVNNAQATLNRNSRTYIRQLNSISKSTSKVKDETAKQAEQLKKYQQQVEQMDETIRKSKFTTIQRLEDEKRQWIEIYRNAGKATVDVEEYYNRQIDAQIEANKLADRKTKNETLLDYLESKGISKTGVELIKEWQKEVAKYNSFDMFSTDPDVIAKNNENQQFLFLTDTKFKRQIADSYFPDKQLMIDAAKEKFKEYNDILSNTDLLESGGFIKGLNDNISLIYKFIANTIKVTEGVDKVVVEGYLHDNYDFLMEALTQGRDKTLQEFSQYAEVLAYTEGELSSEEINEITNYTTILDNIEYLKASLDELMIIDQKFGELKAAGYANDVTNAFFGSPSEENINGLTAINKLDTGFVKLGKTLKNSAKVWNDYGQAVTTILNAVASAWDKSIQKRVENGEITEEQAEKEFKAVKAMQYSLAIINMAAGITQAFSDPSLITWYAKAAAAAAVAATGTAQLITIAQTEIGGAGGTVGGGNSIVYPQMTDTTPYSYTRQVQTDAEREESQAPIYVSVVDIEDAQNKRTVRVNESTF